MKIIEDPAIWVPLLTMAIGTVAFIIHLMKKRKKA